MTSQKNYTILTGTWVIVSISPFTYAGIVTTETFFLASKTSREKKHNTIVSCLCRVYILYYHGPTTQCYKRLQQGGGTPQCQEVSTKVSPCASVESELGRVGNELSQCIFIVWSIMPTNSIVFLSPSLSEMIDPVALDIADIAVAW
jgi:hypothetical protein